MPLKSVILAFYLICASQLSLAQHIQNEQNIEVALRMIGHQILLNADNTTSRVLPIQKTENTYTINFDTEFTFEPSQLAVSIDSIVRQTQLAKNYVVQMQDCNSRETIYSFKVDQITQTDIVPCASREQPLGCYTLLFTINPTNEAHLISKVNESNVKLSTAMYTALGILFIGLLALLGFYIIKQRRLSQDPDLITLGAYTFDKRNTELILENQRIELTHKEADLLLLLYSNANTTVERDEILNKIWEDEGHYVGRTLDVFISKLRKKLELDTKVKIVNIRGVGYKLVVN